MNILSPFFKPLVVIVIISSSIFSCNYQKQEDTRVVVQSDSLLAAKYYDLSSKQSKSSPDSALYNARLSLGYAEAGSNKTQSGNAFSQLGYTYHVTGNLDSAIYYFQLSANEYIQARDTNRYLTVLNNQSGVYVQKSDYKEARRIAIIAKDIATEKDLEEHIADAYGNLGLIEDYKGNTDSSFYFFSIALDYAEKMKDSVRWSRTYNNIGTMFYYAEEYERAIAFLKEAIQYNKSKNNLDYLADNYVNIGVSYDMLEKNDSAYYYAKLAVIIGEQLGDTLTQAKGFHNMGVLLYEDKDFTTALNRFNQSLRLKKSVSEQHSLSSTFQYLSRVNLELGNIERSLELVDSSMIFAIKDKSKENIKESYQVYVEYFKHIKDFEKALEYQEKKEAIKDSIFDIKKLAALYGLEVEYSVNEKDEKIEELVDKGNANYLTMKAIIFTASITIGILVFIFMVRRRKLEQDLQKEELKSKELIHRVNGQFNLTDWYIDQKQIESSKNKLGEVINDIKGLLDALVSINKELISGTKTPLYSSVMHIAENLKFVATEILGKEIKINLKIENLKVKDKDVVYVCTLFNELTMNSIKYAFDEKENPEINFSIHETSNGQLRFSYIDNGVGHNPISKSTGKGLTIISKIVNNIRGKCEINTENGFHFKMDFPKN